MGAQFTTIVTLAKYVSVYPVETVVSLPADSLIELTR